MQITVTGFHVDISDTFHQRAEEGLKDLAQKHDITPVDARVVLSKPTHLFHTDVTLHIGKKLTMRASGEGSDGYTSLAEAFSTLVQQLRRYKKQNTDHHKHRDVHHETPVEAVLSGE